MKRCANYEQLHDGIWQDCYQCHDCETEADYDMRGEEGEILDPEAQVKYKGAVTGSIGKMTERI
jgi:hypothetical protein